MPSPFPIFPSPPVTVRAARALLIAHLQRHGIPDPEATAEFTLAELLGTGRTELLLRGATALNAEPLVRLAQQAERLARHEPLQYVLGTEIFGGRVFRCDRRALIPRPETEGLVERMLACAELRRAARPEIADVGTGSGCIAITLALARPAARVTAVDASAAALSLARENAERLGATAVVFRAGDLLDGFAPRSLDAIVANLPYVATRELAGLAPNVRDHEPASALDGGPDGLRLIERLIAQAAGVLRTPGRIFLEIGEDQGARTAALLRRAGFAAVAIAKDLAGHDRVAEGVLAPR